MLKRMLAGICAALALGTANASEALDANGDAVIEWNRLAMNGVLRPLPPPIQIRFGAIIQLAVFEGVNAIEGDYESTLENLKSPRGASASAAAVSAAHHVLRTYFPDRAAEFDAARVESLARIPDGPARQAGIEVGKAAADAIMARRQDDGSDTPGSYLPGSALPGEWQPTAGCPPEGGVFFDWSKVKPFVIRSASQFRSPSPPALDSAQYARAYEEVLVNGARDSTKRPADRTQVAQFYAEFGDAPLWNLIGRQVAEKRRQSLAQNARTFALLNVALHDLVVTLVDTKYHYHFWRPETAIPRGASDGNLYTHPDPSYVPLIETPCHPSYGSGHAATSAVSREVLERVLGAGEHKFTVSDPAAPGVVLEYSSFEEVTRDIDDARVFGGIHFRFDQQAGGEQGRRVGAYVYKNAFRPRHHCRDVTVGTHFPRPRRDCD